MKDFYHLTSSQCISNANWHQQQAYGTQADLSSSYHAYEASKWFIAADKARRSANGLIVVRLGANR